MASWLASWYDSLTCSELFLELVYIPNKKDGWLRRALFPSVGNTCFAVQCTASLTHMHLGKLRSWMVSGWH